MKLEMVLNELSLESRAGDTAMAQQEFRRNQ